MNTYLLRALALNAQGRDVEAEFDFERGITVEELGAPAESSRYRSLWARFFIRHGAWKNAERLLAEALRISKDHPLALGLRGDLKLRRGQFQSAAMDFLPAFNVSKESRYLWLYAEAKARLGEVSTARAYWEQAEKILREDLSQSNYGHRLELVELLLLRKDPKDISEARELAMQETKLRPGSETYYQLSRALFLSGKPLEALAAMRYCLRSGIRDIDYYTLSAQIERALYHLDRVRLHQNLKAQLSIGFL